MYRGDKYNLAEFGVIDKFSSHVAQFIIAKCVLTWQLLQFSMYDIKFKFELCKFHEPVNV